MATELKARSKGYELTRVGFPMGEVGIIVSVGGWNGRSRTFSREEMDGLFASGDWKQVEDLNLLAETVELLKVDFAEFLLSNGGKGMELDAA